MSENEEKIFINEEEDKNENNIDEINIENNEENENFEEVTEKNETLTEISNDISLSTTENTKISHENAQKIRPLPPTPSSSKLSEEDLKIIQINNLYKQHTTVKKERQRGLFIARHPFTKAPIKQTFRYKVRGWSNTAQEVALITSSYELSLSYLFYFILFYFIYYYFHLFILFNLLPLSFFSFFFYI